MNLLFYYVTNRRNHLFWIKVLTLLDNDYRLSMTSNRIFLVNESILIYLFKILKVNEGTGLQVNQHSNHDVDS